MTQAILDDHLLRDLLVDNRPPGLGEVLAEHSPATTNHYLYRLCRSVISASGGALTGGWSDEHRRSLGGRLIELPGSIRVVPMRVLVFRMAELARAHRMSTLGAEAVAAAEHLSGPLCVWAGDDGPRIRAAARALGADYRTIER